MDIRNIKESLVKYEQVDAYTDYLTRLEKEKNKDKSLKNPWMKYKTDAELVAYFKKVAQDGLSIDGVHITLQSTGISYDYVAYKNKMYLSYPETLIDVMLVYKDDTFEFQKQSGKVVYSHNINNPFCQIDNNVIGGYCVIKNKRGEFITLLDKDKIEKHRKVAKTDAIWSRWFAEMCLKTLIKKAVRFHFADIFQNIETLDNTQYDLEAPLKVDIADKTAIEKIKTLEELKVYWNKNKGRNAGVLEDFTKLVTAKKAKIIKEKEQAKITAEIDDSIRQPGEDDN